MSTPPDPIEDLKRQIAEVNKEVGGLKKQNAELAARNSQLEHDKTSLAEELKDALLGLKPSQFYPTTPSDDPFLTEGYTIQQPRIGKPTSPTALTAAYTLDDNVPQFTFAWKTPEAGAPALYRIDMREGEIEGPQHYRFVEVDGQLTSYTWTFKGSIARSPSYLFGVTAVGADGRRPAPLAVRAVVQ
ncbi:hypothetical protein [Streptomyces sp. WZ-12]|uniref:hypothetical protein n=1 Tax=Streptomyces sp. WZ-12 TaxID=3030210 RepID=UPI0023817EEF|nr:hypothetical protein [Streptomyces sp. WZ-12]